MEMGDNIRIKGEEYAFLVTVLGRGIRLPSKCTRMYEYFIWQM